MAVGEAFFMQKWLVPFYFQMPYKKVENGQD